MYAIAFDLVIADLRQHYDGQVSQAYTDIRNALAPFGYYWVQGSVYHCDDNDLLKVTQAMNALRALPWFPLCVRDIRAYKVEDWSDFTAWMKGNEP